MDPGPRSPSPASSVESLDAGGRKTTEEPEPEEGPARREPPWDSPPGEGPSAGLEVMLGLLRGWEYRPLKPHRGSRLPLLLRPERGPGPCGGPAEEEMFLQHTVPEVVGPCPLQELEAELAEMEAQWADEYVQCGPFRFQQRLLQDRLHYDGAAGRCVDELQKVQDQVQSLQTKIRASETRNQRLQERLADMELELRSAQEEAQQQERNVLNLRDAVVSKEAEAAELYQVIEEQNKMLSSLRDTCSQAPEASLGQTELLSLQASLFQAQLELQAGQRARRQADRAQEDQNRVLERLDKDLQGALQRGRETERHNKELQDALQEARSALQEREEQLRESEQERHREKEERERSVRELQASLQSREQLLEDYSDMLEDQKENRDSLLQKLRHRIKERDQALERAVDEKFRCVEEKEAETRRLQLLLREKERDVETQRCVLTCNEDTITTLEVLVRGKALELQQVSDAWRSVQRQQRDGEECQSRVLRERDAIIQQLQAALQARTQEAQDLRSSLLAQVRSAPHHVLEDLKLRLQLKDRLFQEVLADRSRQAREHQEEVQDLLRTIGSRDQYIQDSGSRLSEVLAEQTVRLQELRRQLRSGSGSRAEPGPELQAVQEELRLALRREKENQELSRTQAGRLEQLSRSLQAKQEIIRDLHTQLLDPSDLPLVERLTQEVQELRESLVQQDVPPARVPVLGRDRPGARQPEFGGLSSEEEDEEDEDLNSEYTESVEDDSSLQGCGGKKLDGESLTVVKQLVEQKQVVERELGELKVQLEKAGFSSLSQMRKALFSLQAENEDLKRQLAEGLQPEAEEEEEELDVTIEGEEEEVEEEEESSELWDAWDGELSLAQAKTQRSDEQTQDGELGAGRLQGEASSAMCEKTVRLQQKSKELQERLMVSEATVQAQAEQLKDYRDLLTETAVQQDSKLVQVDLQDLGYETCGRSENEAEREDASSPEFDDLEMCTSLDCGSQWWPPSTSSSTKAATRSSGSGDEVTSLQRLVEDLRSQLSRSQGVIRGLQSRLRSLSTSSDCTPSTPRKVNWSFQASPSQSGAEEDEGWQSSDGGTLASPRHPRSDTGLQELASRVDALESQLRKGGKKAEDGKAATWPGKFDTLIQAQARELSHLRQRLREGRGVCSILTQHLGDTTKAFEELLRANDIDYYMGQSFREQLAQGSALAQRVSAKISGRDDCEDPDEKTELLAIRLSKELQQKDKVIESLRAKLNQHHHPHRSDTPCSSHALSDTTDQSDRISYVSDEHGSTNEDLELCSDVDGTSEPGQEEARSPARGGADPLSHLTALSRHPSVPSSISSSHRSCPSMHCPGSPHTPAGVQSQTGFSTPQSKPVQGFPFGPQQPADASAFLPLSYQSVRPSPFTRAASSTSLDASLAMKAGAGVLESSALWDMTYGARPARLGADLSSGSSGYQSGTSHTGADLMKEHLREIRALRQRLEDSIQTNDRLRQQLEERLARTAAEKGAPTNIYIQGLDSVSQLSSEVRFLKEANISLQTQLKQASREGSTEAERLREAVLLQRSRLKEAELDAERWAEQSRKLQAEAEARGQEAAQLQQERQRSQETIHRLQHELSVLQQQLSDSRGLVLALHGDLQAYRRVCEVPPSTHSAPMSAGARLDPTELHLQLEQQLIGQSDAQPAAGRRLASDNIPSPPVRDTGLTGPASPHKHQSTSDDQAPTPDGSFANRHGRHVLSRTEDYEALQQQLLEGSSLLQKMEAALRSLNASQQIRLQAWDVACLRKLLSDTQTLKQILLEADSLLRMFWRAALPDPEERRQGPPLREEVASLRLQLAERERALRDATESLRSSSLTRDSMERFIVSQLSRTRDVLKKAKTNLEVKTQEASVSSPSLLVGVS